MSKSGPDRQIRNIPGVGRAHHPLVEVAGVFEGALLVDILQEVGADHIVVGHAGDGDQGRLLHLGVVHAVEHVDRAGPRGAYTHRRLAGELGVPDRR